ncbi:MAG TPA: metallopeptidase family protein, partial [Hyphomicrobiaceae bacterium]|nr:metallopeptidase family protein [Hyphomicrobiaceae bacterium]
MATNPHITLLKAPTLADFEALAADAWAVIPEEFRKRCNNLVIQVEDFPTDEVLDALGIESPFDLMGLYQGVSLEKKSVMDAAPEQDLVYLYRRPM